MQDTLLCTVVHSLRCLCWCDLVSGPEAFTRAELTVRHGLRVVMPTRLREFQVHALAAPR